MTDDHVFALFLSLLISCWVVATSLVADINAGVGDFVA